ncbi:beta-ketoacyl synthase N-terminal-like domain-containing protein [Kitasatospora sp. NPDC097643]|uniref:beta-ketoacyl synthase N-terminal-like domain-containing protein n=1 Tax=Kitasatospora sp. NPDC097643 TaxID=3157230 RepID=UPI00331D908D
MTGSTLLAPAASARPAAREEGGAPAVAPVDILGHGVFSAAGFGPEAIAAAQSRPSAPAGAHGDAQDGVPAELPGEGWPELAVRPVTGFDPVAVLGRKGLSRLSRTDQLVMAACTLAADAVAAPAAQARTGLVLGTTVGSSGAQEVFFRDTFVQEYPYLVNPSAFPGTLMNSAAGKTAIRLGLTGVNATVSGGPLAALHALRYARTALVNGHADRLLAGGVEELSAASAWAWRQSGALHPAAALGEGCGIFVLERAGAAGAGRGVLGQLLACETGYADPVTEGPLGVAGRLAAVVRRALRRSGLPADEPVAVAPGAAARRGWSAVERRALRTALGAVPADRLVRTGALFGETYGASVALQLAAVLARWQSGAAAPGERAAVLTAVGPDGSVGAAVIARPDPR